MNEDKCYIIFRNILNAVNIDKMQYKILLELWEDFSGDDIQVNFPYPVTHGKKHVVQVVSNMTRLLPLSERNCFTTNAVFEIFFGTIIHDIGMLDMIDKGAYSEESRKSRRNHASWDFINKYASNIRVFNELHNDVKERIIYIAYAHSGDDKETLSVKEKKIRRYLESDDARSHHILTGALALRLADLLDIGAHRLIKPHKDVAWHDLQRHHILKHKYISVDIKNEDRAIIIKPDRKFYCKESTMKNIADDSSILEKTMEVLAVYRNIYDEAQKHLSALYGEWRFDSSPIPSLRSINEELFGSIFPLSSGVNLFSMQYRSALDDFFLKRQKNSVFEIDIMGHSQYGRFVNDSEQLNSIIKWMISDNSPGAHAVKFRILLLDPEMENQQMEEVYDAQLRMEPGTERSILPSYDPMWIVNDHENSQGDIWKAINEIEQWADEVGQAVRMELRLTRRLMYAAMTRFGNQMVVSPYRAGGRFQATFALKLSPTAALYYAYQNEFDALWDHSLQTRIYLLKNPYKNENPIKDRIISKGTSADQIRHFDYELSLIKDEKDVSRLLSLLGTNDVPLPPPEIEIQPSASCVLSCEHCIGTYLGKSAKKSTSPWAVCNSEDSDFLQWQQPDGSKLKMESVFDYEKIDSGGYRHRVETVRVSGLSGDPFDEEARDFTLKLLPLVKNYGRKVVLFTNGLAFTEQDVRNKVVESLGGIENNNGDAIHISLDVVEDLTFESLKRGKANMFGQLIQGIREVVSEIRRQKKNIQVTLGFVVTQMNAKEITSGALKLARNIGVDAIRFKPDIRMPRTISLRTWNEFKKYMQEENKTSGPPWVAVINIPLSSSAPPVREKCWAQYYCPTISSSGHLTICDHVAGHIGEARIGSLYEESFEEIWIKSWQNIGTRRSCCFLCPPSKSRLNNFLSEILALSRYSQEDKMRDWILESRKALL